MWCIYLWVNSSSYMVIKKGIHFPVHIFVESCCAYSSSLLYSWWSRIVIGIVEESLCIWMLWNLQEFLNKLNMGSSVKDDQIHQWHPKFALNEVPDIEPASLPQPPVVKTFRTAKDVLDEVKDKHIDSKVWRCLRIYAFYHHHHQERFLKWSKQLRLSQGPLYMGKHGSQISGGISMIRRRRRYHRCVSVIHVC